MTLDREMQTYERNRGRLLVSDPGRFVVISGEELLGTYATCREAAAAGYKEVGLGPFLIKQVLEEEPTHFAVLR